MRVGLGILASTSLLLVGCSSTSDAPGGQSGSATPAAAPATQAAPTATPTAAPVLAAGTERGIGDVPWEQVGEGWMLAVWTPVTPHHPGVEPTPGEPTYETATDVLYLVDPTGDRYAIAEFGPGAAKPDLVEWSGDGSHALFTSTRDGQKTAVSIDLHTGERTVVPIDGTPAYTRPDGKALLVSSRFNGDEPGTLKRIDMAGHIELVYPTETLGGAGQFSGHYIESPDGTQLVLGTANLGNEIVPRSDNSLVVLANDGNIIRTLPAPISDSRCSPVKWWEPGVVLTQCSELGGSGEQLWKVPVDGGAPTALTAYNAGGGDAPGFEGNLGNWNAFELPSGTFLPTAGACGTSFVSRLTPDGHTERVDIPGVSDSVGLVGTSGDDLVVVAQVGCGGGQSMLTYDPVANISTVLLGPPSVPGGVESVRIYPGDE